MAFNVRVIDPLDLQPSKAVGIDLPFAARAVFNSTYETKNAIKANLINYFLTNKGERYMNPGFGSNIRLLLFENINQESLEDIKEVVSRDIELYFPKVLPSRINLLSNPDSNTVTFYMKYSIDSTNIEDELLINFE
jgi:phage baseplate assembly protein W